jgi:hypothetical protein
VVASTTVVFGALLGGVVKLLLEDVQRNREQRSEQARFVTAVLDDLKSVYDRVERVRILIAAHRSALTYGNEMRDLIDSAVQLRNVQRALDQANSGISALHLSDLKLAVGAMEGYLNLLTDEFKLRYKPIADKQRIYEAAFNHVLDESSPDGVDPPNNPAWAELETLPRLGEFRGGALLDGEPASYGGDFTQPLDLATWILRQELAQLRGDSSAAMPAALARTRDHLQPRAHASNDTVADTRPTGHGK